MGMIDKGWALTDKEKQTLRLMVRGHDAKSIARSLDLSVHTINERLRDARRKMAVSSSREAARLLLEAEGDLPAPPAPQSFGDRPIGEDGQRRPTEGGAAPIGGAGRTQRRPWIIGGLIMTFVLALLALAGPQLASAPPQPAAASARPDAEVVASAQGWLELVDQGRWDDSYRATGTAFRKLNTAQAWAAASERVRVPLGPVTSRTLLSQEDVPAPPSGYQLVKFRTAFAGKAEAVETVTLEREGGGWRVVGVTVG